MANYGDTSNQDKQEIKNQLGKPASKTLVPRNFTQTVEIANPVTKFVSYDVTDSFIIGSPTNAIKGTTPIGIDYGPEVLVYVVPTNNVYMEAFVDDAYIDTSETTATISNTARRATFLAGNVLQSEIIYKRPETISSIQVKDIDEISSLDGFRLDTGKLDTDGLGGGNATVQLTYDDGANWHYVFTPTNFTLDVSGLGDYSDMEVKYKIVAAEPLNINEKMSVKIT